MKSSQYTIIFASFLVFFTGMVEAKKHTFHAAGVLPYAIDHMGKIKILIGSSSVHADQASDFGGLRDAIDGSDPQQTAAREGCEELMFILDSDTDFQTILSLRNRYKKDFDITKAQSSCYNYLMNGMKSGCPCVMNNGYIMYFVQIPYDKTIIKKFCERKSFYKKLVPKCWNETVALAWVDLDEILLAIYSQKDSQPITIADFTLYAPFVTSLKKAHTQGAI